MEKLARTLVPDYLKELQVYQAGKPIEEVAREKGLTNISKLASNENPLGPSPYAIKEMTGGLWDLHRYPDMHAFQLKKSLCKLYNLKPGNIILGNGSEGIMAYIARAFLQPGDEVLTCENTFIGFYILTRSVGAHLKKVPLTKDYRFDVEALAKSINEKTKAIYIANPNNPTGTYITKKEFDYLMEYVPDHVIVLLDEAYFEFAKDCDDYPDSMDYRYDNVITLRTFSKAYGLSGIRVGYGFAHEDFITNLSKVKLPFEPNLIGQLGARGALNDTPHLNRTLKNNVKRYNETFEFLTKHDFNPIKSITNFITYKTGSLEASEWMFEHLLNEGVIIRPLKANEMPDYVRVSLGNKEEMQHYFEAMEKILPKYNDLFGRAKK
ncbi:histidinol-phosphate transaminase [Halobacteriovorax sp. JY17]|uniref:histidinol-phosphate transaminase n=1 Tax=Halobacteriovorax sp. JY17 TaxID=2014617 RepID=UPI000C5B2331|nr:histidinol-phosphate transaminase [Halobacteriovorax sp. JY17]PIK14586.1 MAG: histidinol-phosphate transaminase [Halobacteriovorax sp. JY17]